MLQCVAVCCKVRCSGIQKHAQQRSMQHMQLPSTSSMQHIQLPIKSSIYHILYLTHAIAYHILYAAHLMYPLSLSHASLCCVLCCSVLQCIPVWCSVLQCGAVCCSVLQYAAVQPESFRLILYIIQMYPICFLYIRGSVLQRVAACCSVLQYDTSINMTRIIEMYPTRHSDVSYMFPVLQACVLQRVAACCSVLQCVVACCSTTRIIQMYPISMSYIYVLYLCAISMCYRCILYRCATCVSNKSVRDFVAVCCGVLRRVTVCCSMLQCIVHSLCIHCVIHIEYERAFIVHSYRM